MKRCRLDRRQSRPRWTAIRVLSSSWTSAS